MSCITDVSSLHEKTELDSVSGRMTVSTQVGIGINSLATAIQALRHHKSQFAAWKLKHPTSAEEFSTAADNILQIERFLTKLDADHTDLLGEVKSQLSLQDNLNDLKSKYSTLELRHSTLELEFREFKLTSAAESEKQKSIIRAFDLIRMYRKYYAEDIVGGDWGSFCEEFYRREEDVYLGNITQSEFDAYLKPFDDRLEDGLTFAQIMKLTGDRHEIANTYIRSSSNQQAFLAECSKVEFNMEFQSDLIASKILPALKTVSLRRMN